MLLTVLIDEKEKEIEIDMYKLFYIEKVYVTEDIVSRVSNLLHKIYNYSDVSELTITSERDFESFKNTDYQTELAQIFIADNFDCIYKILDQNRIYDASFLDVVSIANLAIDITLHKILQAFIENITSRF